MPNWTNNKLTITAGSDDFINEITDAFKAGYLFNYFVNFPAHLGKSDDNFFTEKTGQGDINLEIKPLSDSSNNHQIFPSLIRRLLMGANMWKKPRSSFPKMDSDYTNWYDWVIANWGTQWDVGLDDDFSNLEINPQNNLELTLSFDTAWSPPIRFYESFFVMKEVIQLNAEFSNLMSAYRGTWINGVLKHEDTVQEWRSDGIFKPEDTVGELRVENEFPV